MTTTPPRGCDASGRARYAAIWSPPSPAMVTEPAVMASELSAWGMSHGPFELRGRHGMRTVVPQSRPGGGRRGWAAAPVGRTPLPRSLRWTPMPSTLDWLRARDDRALVALLRARPDLTVPAPGDLTVLAGRLNTGPSVWRAMESLNQFHVQVLQGLAVLGAEKRAVARTDLQQLLGATVPSGALDAALGKLEGLALVRGSDQIHMPSAVLAVLGPYPAGLGSPGTLTVAAATAAVQNLEPAARGLLDRLATGIPRGTTDSRSKISKAVTTLITDGLLRRVDPATVELPREVGLALRGDEPLGQIHVEPPRDTAVKHGVPTVDGTGGG